MRIEVHGGAWDAQLAKKAVHTYYQKVLVDDSTPTSVGCSAGVVPTVAPLHRGDGEDVVCHCDSVTTSDRCSVNVY